MLRGVTETFSIKDVAAQTGVTAHTLRYYERIGLLRGVPRAASGHRRYRAEDVRWVEFLRKLHATGMPIRRMQEYASLLRKGDSTIVARQRLLDEHRKDVESRIEVLTTNLEMIRKKIRFYAQRTAKAS
ncbi:transcriptional regulator, MerR family [Labilithrix luteola]|uniref:Transcriptional regulator, MerR family n=1 Tax=Labilithrix luteola TaxID=1391654 RepID=A0A0K1Q034_9BACT|nr:transcriptional regulator, MerR family [Labilithrix luteola]